MNSGTEQLRHEAGALDEALRAFDAPVVDELAGLRLMRRVLIERRDQVADKLRDAERHHLTLEIDDAAADAPVAALVGRVLDAVQHAVSALAAEIVGSWSASPDPTTVADEVRLRLGHLDAGPPVEIDLHFVRTPDRRLTDPDDPDTPLLTAVQHALLDRLAGDAPDPVVAPLAREVSEGALGVTVSAVLPGGDRRSVTVTRDRAQQLAAAVDGS